MNVLHNTKTLFIFFFAICLGLSSNLTGQEAKTAAGLYNDGLALLKEKNYAEGLTAMEAALAKAQEDANEKVIDLSKKNGAMAAYNLGNSKRTAKALDEALALYTKGIGLNPAYSSNYIGKARVEASKGMTSDAMTTYLKAAEVAKAAGKDSKVEEATKRAKSLITSAYNAKKNEDVISLGKAFLSGMANSDVNYYVGKSMMNMENHADAVGYFDTALTSATEKKDRIFYAKAQSLEKLGKNADAVAAYKLITDEKYKANAAHKISTLK